MTTILEYRDDRPVPADTTLVKLFLEAVDRHGDRPAFEFFKSEAVTASHTYREVFTVVKTVAAALRARGIKGGDRVAILSDNRPEWALADYGCLLSGVIGVPVYPTLTAPQVAYILRDSGARLVFVSDAVQGRKAVLAGEGLDRAPAVVSFDDQAAAQANGIESWSSFLASAAEHADAESAEDFRSSALSAAPGDTATIIYTSGTTGDPKGVELSQHNVASNVHACHEIFNLAPGDSTVSFLPLSHIFQRMVDYLCFWSGCTIGYPRVVPDTLMDDLRVLSPTLIAAVPRIYEKLHAGVTGATGVKGKLVRWAVGVADRVADRRLSGHDPTGLLAFKYGLADKLVFSKVRDAVGGRVATFVSGGGPLAPELGRFFYSIGCPILEGYGLTETSPVTNVNSPEHFRIGSVGRPVKSTEIQIADDGEILIRGPQVMRGYYRCPEATAEVIDADGWFATGDIGEIDTDGFLYITDRKKDLIVTAGGKNVAPQPIENLVKMNQFVEQTVLIGDARPYCVMLIVPAFPTLQAWADDKAVEAQGPEELVEHPVVVAHLEEQVESMCADLAPFETPKRIAVLAEELTVENGFLTPTMKVKRAVVRERLGRVIERLYRD